MLENLGTEIKLILFIQVWKYPQKQDQVSGNAKSILWIPVKKQCYPLLEVE